MSQLSEAVVSTDAFRSLVVRTWRNQTPPLRSQERSAEAEAAPHRSTDHAHPRREPPAPPILSKPTPVPPAQQQRKGSREGERSAQEPGSLSRSFRLRMSVSYRELRTAELGARPQLFMLCYVIASLRVRSDSTSRKPSPYAQVGTNEMSVIKFKHHAVLLALGSNRYTVLALHEILPLDDYLDAK